MLILDSKNQNSNGRGQIWDISPHPLQIREITKLWKELNIFCFFLSCLNIFAFPIFFSFFTLFLYIIVENLKGGKLPPVPPPEYAPYSNY